MFKNKFERDGLISAVHSQRFKILQYYMYLYGERLAGDPCLYDRYNEGELVGKKEGENCVQAMVVTHAEELKLLDMLKQLESDAVSSLGSEADSESNVH